MPTAAPYRFSAARHAAASGLTALAVMLTLLAGRAVGQQDFRLPGLSPAAPASPGGVTGMAGSADKADVFAEADHDRVDPGQQLVVAVVIDVQPGFHAQSHKPRQEGLIAFELKDVAVSAGEAFAPIYPEGEIEHYPALVGGEGDGNVSVYTGRAVIYVPVRVSPDAEPGTTIAITGGANFQICDANACLQPTLRPVPWRAEVEVVAAGQSAVSADADLFDGFDKSAWANLQPAAPAGETAATASNGDAKISFLGFDFDFTDAGILFVLPLAFLAGIVFNVVPCVLPVLPLKAMGFYEVAQHNRGKCLALGVAFSLGITLTFAALAVVVLVLKWVQWGEQFGNVYFAGGVALVLVAMALYQFGLFTINLPSSVYSVTPRHDTYGGNVLFGILTAVLSTPCTFGLFFGVLIWATAQPAVVGVAAVTTVGVGMAFPYLILSAFPELARNFPRTGPWSELVKQATGFLLLAVAAYFARPLLPASIRGEWWWWVVYGCLAAGGVFAVAQAIRYGQGRLRPILVTAVLAALVLVPTGVAAAGLANPPAGWVEYSPETLAEAREKGGPVVVKFTADWCLNCKTVEQTVFGTQAQMDDWRDGGATLMKADLSDPNAIGWPLLETLNRVGAIPFTAVYLPGQEQPVKLAGIYGSGDLRAAFKP